MCRITGFWDFNTNTTNSNEQTLIAMRDALTYGGPDAAGLVLKPLGEAGVLGLGHRRLSILDLSPSGAQPMVWQHLTVVFNGELYNFKEVQQELAPFGYTFDSSSDTEVLLKAWEHWGADCLSRFRGMFAFAMYDAQQNTLTLVRDRLGVKPLFVYHHKNTFLFASELKAFHHHPAFEKQLNPAAVSLFLQQGYIPAPHCIFDHCQKLLPGHILSINAKGETTQTAYWSANAVYENAQNNPAPTHTAPELIQSLEDILTESFELRMVADVPVGMFLSGGIDSSLVTALLQKNATQALKTFTIGFEDKNLNEAEHAARVAKHIGTQHTELICTEADFKTVLPLLPDMYDEPCGDSSAIPTYLVSRLARQQVTVSLSADGGDELFGGYTKYEAAKKFYPKIQGLPAKGLLKACAQSIDPNWLERNAKRLPIVKNYAGVANKFSKFRNALAAKDLTDFFNLSSVYLTETEQRRLFPSFQSRQNTPNYLNKLNPQNTLAYLGLLDINTYLEGDILTKVDRATMQVALEGREPLLDHKVVEFALQLPDEWKIREGKSKWILRQILYKYVPQDLIERPKQGFAIPVEAWLRGILRPDLEQLCHDKHFFEHTQLVQSETNTLIQQFINQTKYVNPHVIWHLYSLHQWWMKWAQ